MSGILYKVINLNKWTRNSSVFINYKLIKLRNKIKRTLAHKTENVFLFILSPPYCGSTLLNELISTSKNVSVNNNIATREGQQLPELKEMMFEDKDDWKSSKQYPWEYIKSIWMQYWDVTKPVLLEKSPPNVLRAFTIKEVFQPSYFICLTRNPYAHIEGVIRRDKVSVELATKFALMCLKYQKKNLESLENSILIRYEDLVSNQTESVNKIKNFLPVLSDIKVKDKFKSHNYKKQNLGLTNLNLEKISKLSPENMKIINSLLVEKKELLTYFGYTIVQ